MKVSSWFILLVIFSLLCYSHIGAESISTHIALAIIYGFLSSVIFIFSIICILAIISIIVRHYFGEENE